MDCNPNNYIYKVITELRKIEDNQICADCNLLESSYVSINNGNFLCFKCADFHSVFGKQISFLRNLDDEFDEYLILYLIRGGNARYKNFLKDSGLDITKGYIERIYLSKGLDFYRQNVNKFLF